MRIASSTLEMEASHFRVQEHTFSERLRVWSDNGAQTTANQSLAATRVELSAQAQMAQFAQLTPSSTASSTASAIQDGLDASDADPVLRLLRQLIAMLTGKTVRVFDASDLQQAIAGQSDTALPTSLPVASTPLPSSQSTAVSSGAGLTYSQHETYSEQEQTAFQANGTIRTSDGQSISFSLGLTMQRSYYEASDTQISIGSPRRTQDPLVINFGGSAAQLSSRRFAFDLDADGTSEQINALAGGSGFLALDRNGDGKINDGTELFGAQSGNGFADLAKLDSDGNGWIDENDAAYNDLRVWTQDANGNDQLVSLQQAGVGALNTGSVASPFDLTEANNTLDGRIRSTGVYLHENGSAGTLQQVDLTV